MILFSRLRAQTAACRGSDCYMHQELFFFAACVSEDPQLSCTSMSPLVTVSPADGASLIMLCLFTSCTQRPNTAIRANESHVARLVAKVGSLAQGQPPAWEASALRALDNENEFVRRGIFAKSDAAATSYINGLIAGAILSLLVIAHACHAKLHARNCRPHASYT